MISSHVSALRAKHAAIEARLHRELARPVPDAAAVQTMKKRKLVLKQEIAAS